MLKGMRTHTVSPPAALLSARASLGAALTIAPAMLRGVLTVVIQMLPTIICPIASRTVRALRTATVVLRQGAETL